MTTQPTIRPLTPADAEAWRALLDSCFGRLGQPAPDQTEEDYLHVAEARGLFLDGRLVAGLRAFALSLLYGTKLVPASGMSRFVVDPDLRRRGLFSLLTGDALRLLKEKGCAFSVLHPFDYGFYERSGWAQANDTVEYEVPLADLPLGSGATGRTRTVARCRLGEAPRVEEGTLPALDAVYRRYAAGYNGMVERDKDRWYHALRAADWALEELRCTTLWEDGHGQTEGYVIWVLPALAHEQQGIDLPELVATSDAAYRGLLRFLRNQEAQYPRLSVELPPADPFPFYLPDPRVKREIKAGSMLRIVEVAAALEATAEPAPGLEGDLTLALTDPVCPWNRGEWRLEIRDGMAAATNPAGPDPRVPKVELGIGTLAQILCGRLKASLAERIGRLRADSQEAVDLLDATYGARPPHLADHF